MCKLMATPTQIEQVAERTERLLVRYRELQRANQLLTEQVAGLAHERDSLKSRLGAARARIDALLERLPQIGNPPAIRPAPRKDAE
jgi:cell division protein ZapB